MEYDRVPDAARRPFRGAFHDYVRGMFAERSARARVVRASRPSWLHGLSQRAKIRIIASNRYSRD